MLKRTNILAMVGGGINPKFSKNKITIFDSHQSIIISQIRFNSNITKVKLGPDCIIGFIIDKIYIFNINTLETIDIIEINQITNPIFGSSNINNTLVIAYPQYNNKGKLEIGKYFITKNKYKKETLSINAHESNIVFITINNEGTLIVTGSEKGQCLRIFDTLNGNLLAELKRGKTKIYWISIDSGSDIVGYISEVGKVYLYNISEIKKGINNKNKNKNNKSEENNSKENINKIHEINKINIKSFAKFKINENKNIIGFIEPKSVVILNVHGKLYKTSYNENTGKICFLNEASYIKIDNK
jgi:hypothetical protein